MAGAGPRSDPLGRDRIRASPARRGAASKPGGANRAQSRPELYRALVLGIGQLLAVTVALDGIDRWRVLRKSLTVPRQGLAWILGCVAAHQVISLTAMVLRRIRGLPLEAGTARLLPRTGAELWQFVPLALMAGVGEEFVYRGFAPDHLVRWGLSTWLAVAIATLSFGLSHGYKSVVGMLRSALGGLVLAVPVLATGTLLPSIIAHATMDLLAGANMLRLARRLGVAIPEAEPPTAATDGEIAARSPLPPGGSGRG